MWRKLLVLLLAMSLGVVSVGCPQEQPVVPPPEDVPPAEAPEEPDTENEEPGSP